MDSPTIAPSGKWTLGVLVGLPFVCIAVLLLLAACIGCIIWAFKADSYDKFAAVGSAIVAPIVLAGFILGMIAAYWPLDASYHQYRTVQGTVAQVSSRLIAGDKATNQKFVVVFKGSAQQFGVDDTRAALIKSGDTITLSCKKTYQYAGKAGYDCNWGGS